MNFSDVIKKSFLEGFSNTDISTTDIVVTLVITFLIGLYIFFIYKLVSKSALYDKSFHVSMALISVITAGIIIAMQSSIVISLGMVGALSIVRFRTAIKNPMDLLFLFWSIGTGIICGAGLFEIALLVALITTVGIVILEYLPGNKKTSLLIINGRTDLDEDQVSDCVKKYAKRYSIKSRNLKKSGTDLLFEVSTAREKELVQELRKLAAVEQLSLLQHDGEVRF
ncbi:MAG: DUF4956 domain-containing protein [Lachnospiraceae bacterium]|nr:DUF4956 domain-containing protein [Lachnospiraceae bacterium]